MKPAVLIVCTGNSCRSQMAEGILRAAAGDSLEVYSAGSKPAGYVHPLAVQALAEIGLDISRHRSKSVDEFVDQGIQTVIAVCGQADTACPMYPGEVERLHWPFEDPALATGTKEEQMQVFRKVRDEIKVKFQSYATERRRRGGGS